MNKRKHRIKNCMMCHRALTDKDSQRRGYGPHCFLKRPSLGYRELEQFGQVTLFDWAGL